MSPPPLILASTSSARRQLLADAGIVFDIEPSGIDEEEVKRSLAAERSTPQSVAETLAELKALRVSAKHPQAMVIGADQTLACNGRLFDKPPTVEAAHGAYGELVEEATDKVLEPQELAPLTAYEMAATVDFGLDAKQGLLDLRSENARLRLLTRLFRAALRRLEFIERAQARARSNGKVRFS